MRFLLVFLLFYSILSHAQFFDYPVPYSYEVHFNSDVVHGDVDGNGMIDIVYLPANSHHVDIYFQELDGAYSKQRFNTGLISPDSLYGTYLEVRDLNNDNLDDLVVVYGYKFSCNRVFIHFSEGRTFQEPIIFQIDNSTNSGPASILVDDFNNDQVPDILVGTFYGDTYGWKGLGNKHFEPFKITNYTDPGNLIVADDFNQDGLMDFASVDGANTQIKIYENQGDMVFQFKEGLFTNISIARVISGDFNGDHFPDLIVSYYGNNTALTYFKNESGNSYVKSDIELPENNYTSFGLGAFDNLNDGIDDFVVTGGGLNGFGVFVYEGNSSSNFAVQKITEKRYYQFAIDLAVTSNSNSFDLTVATVGEEIIAYNLQSAKEINRRSYFQTNISPAGQSPVKLDDLDMDGHVDMLIGNYGNNSLSVHFGNGDGTFDFPVFYKTSGWPTQIEINDINNDGIKDIVYATYFSGEASEVFETGETGILIGNDGHGFTKEVSIPVTGQCFAIADFNKDGIKDIINQQALYLGNIMGAFTAHEIPLLAPPIKIIAADLDHDGNQDYLSYTDGGISFVYGKGDGSFEIPVYFSVSGTSKSQIYAEDLNHDSWIDFYTTSEIQNELVQIVNKGSRQFEKRYIAYSSPYTPYSICFNDFNNDGHTDIAVGTEQLAKLQFYFGDGNNNFSSVYETSQQLGSGSICSSDLNGDGLLDIVGSGPFGLSYYFGRLTDPGPLPEPKSVTASCTVVSDTLYSPTNLHGFIIDNGIKLSWLDNSLNESGFIIQKRISNADFSTVDTVDTNMISWFDTSVEPGVTYQYRVFAFNSSKTSSFTNNVDIVFQLKFPMGPTNLKLDSLKKPNLYLSWDDNSRIELGYIIEKSVNTGASFFSLDTLEANAKTYIDNEWQEGYQYTYRVRAFAESGSSGYSNTVQVSLPISIPEPPSNLEAAIDSITVEMTWTDNSTNESGFIIQRMISDGVYISIDTVSENVNSFIDSPLKPGEYKYRILAFNQGGTSVPSNEITVRILVYGLLPEQHLKAVVTGKTVHLTWDDESEDEIGFVLERADNFNDFIALDTILKSKTHLEDSNVEFGNVYSYRIYSYNDTGVSQYSNVETVLVLAPPFPNPANDRICIQLHINLAFDIHMSFVNAMGAALPSGTFEVKEDMVCIFIGQLESGVYYFIISGNNQKLTYRIVKESNN